MTAIFQKFRARLAEKIAPIRPVSRQGVARFVKVRFFAPLGVITTESYDTENPLDMTAWRENQRLYACQVVCQSAEPFEAPT